METLWLKTDDGYSLQSQGEALATFRSVPAGCTANISIGAQQYKIYRKGFWQSTIIIQGPDGETAIKPMKWYGRKWQFTIDDKSYTLSIGNKPMASWTLTENGNELLTYAFDSKKSINGLRIEGNSANPLLHSLLLYLMLPVLNENSDDFTVLMLTLAATS